MNRVTSQGALQRRDVEFGQCASAGEPVRVAALGGSVTAGGGSLAPDQAYVSRVAQWLLSLGDEATPVNLTVGTRPCHEGQLCPQLHPTGFPGLHGTAPPWLSKLLTAICVSLRCWWEY